MKSRIITFVWILLIGLVFNVMKAEAYAAENEGGYCVLDDAFINGGNSCSNFTELDDVSLNVWCDGSGIRIDSASTSAVMKYDNALYPRNDTYKYNRSVCMWVFQNQTTNFGSGYTFSVENSTTSGVERYFVTYTTANAKEHMAVPVAAGTVLSFIPIRGNHWNEVCHEFYTNNSMVVKVNGTQFGYVADLTAGETDPNRNKNASYLRFGWDPNLNVPLGVGVANFTHYNLSCIVPFVATLNITQPNVSNPSSVIAGDNVSINFTLKTNNGNSLITSTLENVTVGGVSADILTIPCGGTATACNGFANQQESCTNASCSFTASGTSPQYNESFNNTGSAPADWATWQATGSGISNMVNSVTSCINDDNDDCLCVNSTAETFQGHLKKQSDVDLSGCVAGTAYVYIGKLSELGTLETSDCINISFSNNSGASFTNKTKIFCDDNPPSTLNITITNSSYYVSTFRINITAGGFGAEPELGCLDNIFIGCQPIASTCTGTPTGCYSYTNSSRCQSAGCTPFKQQFGYSNFWQVNATMPSGLTGLQNLFVNVTHTTQSGSILEFNDTEANALDFGGGADITPPTLKIGFNATTLTTGTFLNFTGNATDETALFSGNWTYNQSNSVTKINYTFSSTFREASNTTPIVVSAGEVINFTFYATDTSNNVVQLSQKFTVQSANPCDTTCTLSTGLVNDGCICNLTSDTHIYPTELIITNGGVTVISGTLTAKRCKVYTPNAFLKKGPNGVPKCGV